jgi:hypothetical protein
MKATKKLFEKELAEKREHHNAVVKAWRKKDWKKFQADEKANRAEPTDAGPQLRHLDLGLFEQIGTQDTSVSRR